MSCVLGPSCHTGIRTLPSLPRSSLLPVAWLSYGIQILGFSKEITCSPRLTQRMQPLLGESHGSSSGSHNRRIFFQFPVAPRISVPRPTEALRRFLGIVSSEMLSARRGSKTTTSEVTVSFIQKHKLDAERMEINFPCLWVFLGQHMG